MARKLDFKEFYEQTKYTKELIDYLDFNTKRCAIPKDNFIEVSNLCFGLLAHLRIDGTETSRFQLNRLSLFQVLGYDRYQSYTFNHILTRLNICRGVQINPSAIPTIKRYIELFDAYEEQNGMVSLFSNNITGPGAAGKKLIYGGLPFTNEQIKALWDEYNKHKDHSHYAEELGRIADALRIFGYESNQ